MTTGTRVQLYSIRTRKLLKTITRFTDLARCGTIRRDGRVLVAGDDTGRIQVFDISSRAILKTWDEHKQPVWATAFSPTELTTVMSASDDRTVRLWDLPSQKSTMTWTGHTDYVRCGQFMPGQQSGMVVSGSYDGMVKLWDPRASDRAAMTFKHAAPVETVLPTASGTTVLAAADNQISVLDLVAGKPLEILRSHQKTVTSLCWASDGTRLVSGGLDGHVKIFETTGWNVVAGSKYPSPVLSLCVVPSSNKEDKHLVVGMQSGTLSIRTRLSGDAKVKEREREKEMAALLAGTLDSYDKQAARKRKRAGATGSKAKHFVGEAAEIVIEGDEDQKRHKELDWEKDLRLGRYAAALDRVIEENNPVKVLTVLMALRHRSALRAALQGRDENSVQPVFKWICRHITDPRYVTICVDSAMHLLDLYSEHVGDSKEMQSLVRRLHSHVRMEVDRSQQAIMTSGMLQLLVGGLA